MGTRSGPELDEHLPLPEGSSGSHPFHCDMAALSGRLLKIRSDQTFWANCWCKDFGRKVREVRRSADEALS